MQKRPKTQLLWLVRHLNTGQPITPLNAMVNFHIARLAARIHDINKAASCACRELDEALGPVEMTMREVKAGGKTTRFASYQLCSDCYPNGFRLDERKFGGGTCEGSLSYSR